MKTILTRTSTRRILFAAIAVVLVAGTAGAAYAQSSGDQATPKGWSYEIKDGKRVPKATRTIGKDGSWREEVRQGNCVTVKERSATGEYKETRQCNPNNPG